MRIRGIIGKIPSEGDFVRHNLIDPLPRGFDRWLAASVEHAATLGLPTSSDPLRFIFSDGKGTGVLVGVIAPSHDAVGRRYPIALFEWCREATSPSDLSSLPLVYQGFLESLVELAGAIQGTTAADLKSALESLPHMGSDGWAHARALAAETLDRTTALAFEERVFEAHAAKRYYAYHTLLTAVSVLTRGASFGAPPTVDCPISTDVDQFAWLELFGRCLPRGASMPTVLWCEDEAPRMAVVLGSPSHLDYRFRTDDGNSDRLWPLTTTSAVACESARERLLSVDPSFGVDDGSLRGLLERVARARQAYVPGEVA